MHMYILLAKNIRHGSHNPAAEEGKNRPDLVLLALFEVGGQQIA